MSDKPKDAPVRKTMPCPSCSGRKTIAFATESVPCATCDATGRVPVDEPKKSSA